MKFFNTSTFERHIKDLKIKKSEIDSLKQILAENPKKGDVVKGTGGCRKIRMSINNIGKRSGARVIYLYLQIDDCIYFLVMYQKNEKTDITKDDMKLLKKYSKFLKERKK
ncbi:MAG: type II toxin-antitoxin system RelE/ParE family toxin [Spirochaetes bacterium]|nr:type II toxin-antitoxin system RelE/ParE family toxin [Spirochaetota bacterium]